MTDRGRPGDACTVVIFGASGDLCKRKLIPALYNLMNQGLLPENYAVVGVATRPLETATFRTYMTDSLKEFAGDKIPHDRIPEFVKGLYYTSGDFNDKATYEKLAKLLKEVDA
ncbi:glucose-6-phosphate dehydrogenase, partial [bacterium]|nr:glucose-6-phosphate dehydrogenase [bacterium]